MRAYISQAEVVSALSDIAQRADPAPRIRRLSVRDLDEGQVLHAHLAEPATLPSLRTGFLICFPASSSDGKTFGAGEDFLDILQQLSTVVESCPAALVVLCRPSADATQPAVCGFWVDFMQPERQECEVRLVPGREALFARTRGLLPGDRLAGKKICIVGVGSGGSACAIELAKCGVGKFSLFDFDRLDLHNIARHCCGLSDLGRHKTRAVRDLIHNKNPYCAVETSEIDILERPDQLETAIMEADLVIAGTDNNRSRRTINRLCLKHGRVSLYGRIMLRACGGDVLRVSPGNGPCYECVLDGIWRRKAEEISTQAQAATIADYGVVAEPGLSNDILPTASMLVRLAIQELVRGTGSPLELSDEDLPFPFYMWANRREEQYAHWEPMGNRIDGLAILRWYGVRIESNPQCPACGTFVPQ